MYPQCSAVALLVAVCCLGYVQCTTNTELTNQVGEGNYSYFYVEETGSVKLTLVTHSGDADLFVSRSFERPSFSNYEYKADSCGVDVVEANLSGKVRNGRLYVAVFGASGHPVSRYTVKVTAAVKAADRGGASSTNQSHSDDSLSSTLVSILQFLFDIILEVAFAIIF